MTTRSSKLTSDQRKKLDSFTLSAVTKAAADTKTQVYTKLCTTLEDMRINRRTIPSAVDAINDCLTSTELSRSVGHWVFTEFGDGLYVFVKLGDYLPGVASEYLLNTEVSMLL